MDSESDSERMVAVPIVKRATVLESKSSFKKSDSFVATPMERSMTMNNNSRNLDHSRADSQASSSVKNNYEDLEKLIQNGFKKQTLKAMYRFRRKEGYVPRRERDVLDASFDS